jgi:hypothetical protein
LQLFFVVMFFVVECHIKCNVKWHFRVLLLCRPWSNPLLLMLLLQFISVSRIL